MGVDRHRDRPSAPAGANFGSSPSGRGPVILGLLTLLLCLPTCYSPRITPQGLKCAMRSGTPPTADVCPDGFVCVGGFCDLGGQGGGAGSSGGGKGGGSGAAGQAGQGGTCASPIAPLCSGQGESPCDPVCQTGCACGLRCVASGATPQCVPPATVTPAKLEGDICDPSAADSCAPGYVCAPEPCGVNLGRCYQYCRDSSQCGAQACRSHAGITRQVCNLAPAGGTSVCDPIANTGCESPILACYISADPKKTICDCPGTKHAKNGESCNISQDCDMGLTCLSVQPDPSHPKCVPLCGPSSPQCATDCVMLGSGPFTYCPP